MALTCRSTAAVSRSSTMNVESPAAMLSLAPMRVKMRSRVSNDRASHRRVTAQTRRRQRAIRVVP